LSWESCCATFDTILWGLLIVVARGGVEHGLVRFLPSSTSGEVCVGSPAVKVLSSIFGWCLGPVNPYGGSLRYIASISSSPPVSSELSSIISSESYSRIGIRPSRRRISHFSFFSGGASAIVCPLR